MQHPAGESTLGLVYMHTSDLLYVRCCGWICFEYVPTTIYLLLGAGCTIPNSCSSMQGSDL